MLAMVQYSSPHVQGCLSPLIFGEMIKLVKPVLSLCFLHHRGLAGVYQVLRHTDSSTLILCKTDIFTLGPSQEDCQELSMTHRSTC